MIFRHYWAHHRGSCRGKAWLPGCEHAKTFPGSEGGASQNPLGPTQTSAGRLRVSASSPSWNCILWVLESVWIDFRSCLDMSQQLQSLCQGAQGEKYVTHVLDSWQFYSNCFSENPFGIRNIENMSQGTTASKMKESFLIWFLL